MSLIAPALLGALVALPAIIAIYLLRAERNSIHVPSTMLWRNLLLDREAQTRVRPPPWSLLLALQLLAALVAALALAQPLFATEAPEVRRFIVIIDASASMRATDVTPSRLDAAKEEAKAVLRGVGGEVSGVVIRAGATPRVLADGRDPARLQLAVDLLEPGDSAGNLAAAWRLAGSLAAGRTAQSEIVVISDGAADVEGLVGAPATARFVRVGASSENQAIVEAGVRRSTSGGARASAFVRVANTGSLPAVRQLRILADGLQIAEQQVALQPRGSQDFVFEPPIGTRIFTAVLLGSDPLASDDRADLLIPRDESRTALLVSDAPGALERALRAISDLSVTIVSPDAYDGAGTASLVVFDRFWPGELPLAPTLIVAPQPGSPLFAGFAGRPGYVVAEEEASPLLRDVDLSAAEFRQTVMIAPPPWMATVASGLDGPLVLAGERDGWRAVVFAFEPASSNLPRLIAFPTLMANIVDWIAPPQPVSAVPGEPVRLPPGLLGALVRPGGGSSDLAGVALFAQTEQAGRYQRQLPGAAPETVFFVNVLNEGESEIAPREVRLPAAQRTASLAVRPPGLQAGGFPLWPALGGALLALLAAEWVVWTRRGIR